MRLEITRRTDLATRAFLHLADQGERTKSSALAEAVAIGKRFRAAPRAPRDPHAVVRLLTLREESGLSVADFARRVGVSAPTIYLWAKGCSSSGNVGSISTRSR